MLYKALLPICWSVQVSKIPNQLSKKNTMLKTLLLMYYMINVLQQYLEIGYLTCYITEIIHSHARKNISEFCFSVYIIIRRSISYLLDIDLVSLLGWTLLPIFLP